MPQVRLPSLGVRQPEIERMQSPGVWAVLDYIFMCGDELDFLLQQIGEA